MKKIVIILTILLTLPFSLSAQENAPVPISRQIYSFSPMAHVYLNNLGLTDTNNNGVIDREAGEGYEEFIVKYGNADTGFHANYVLCGEANGKLEEPEIINYYYLTIRFKPEFEEETAAIESEVVAYIYANNMPLVWLDDEQGTVMNAVNRVLGEGWNRQRLTENEAIALFNRAMGGMNISGRTGFPRNNGGYYTLPEFVTRRMGYCVEVAQFGFWFFSQLQIRSLVVDTALTPSLAHSVIKLNNTNTIIDYFRTSNPFNVPVNQWANFDPIKSIGEYYYVLARSNNNRLFAEQSVIYSKYDIPLTAYLMNMYSKNPLPNHTEIIEMGGFILNNIDIPRVMASDAKEINSIKNTFERILSVMIECYSATRNRAGFNNVEHLLNQYYSHDPNVRPFLDYYRF